MLCWRRMCFARASDRVKDLSHSVQGQTINETSGRLDSPGREHINGFSPVCERMCEMSAKRDVCASPRRLHVDHSQV